MVFLTKDIKDAAILVILAFAGVFIGLIIIAFLRDQGQLGILGTGLIGAIINPLVNGLNGFGGFLYGLWNAATQWVQQHLSIYGTIRISTYA